MNERLRKYKAYGIAIESEIELPDLLEVSENGQVQIFYGNIEQMIGKSAFVKVVERPDFVSRVSKDAVLLEYAQVGKFLISKGCEIIVQADSAAVEADLQPFLSGPALAVLLHQRKFLVLHASAVKNDGRCAVFLGEKGAGKSTLAAHLQNFDYLLLSDDIVPLSRRGKNIETCAGYPKIKLFADSVNALGEKAENFPLIHRFTQKYSYSRRRDFSFSAASVSAIYVLAINDGIAITRLSAAEAFLELTRYSHLNKYLAATDSRKLHFEQCRNVAENVPVFRFQRPHDFARVNQTIHVFTEHFNSQINRKISISA